MVTLTPFSRSHYFLECEKMACMDHISWVTGLIQKNGGGGGGGGTSVLVRNCSCFPCIFTNRCPKYLSLLPNLAWCLLCLIFMFNGSEQQLELGKGAFSHPPSSTVFSKGLLLMLLKNMMERSARAEYYQYAICQWHRKNVFELSSILPLIWSSGGQGWILPVHLGQMKTGQEGKGLLQNHLWCPNDLGYGID